MQYSIPQRKGAVSLSGTARDRAFYPLYDSFSSVCSESEAVFCMALR